MLFAALHADGCAGGGVSAMPYRPIRLVRMVMRVERHDAPASLKNVRPASDLYACELQELLVGLDALSQELAVLEQRVGRDRSWRILGLLTADDVNGF